MLPQGHKTEKRILIFAVALTFLVLLLYAAPWGRQFRAAGTESQQTSSGDTASLTGLAESAAVTAADLNRSGLSASQTTAASSAETDAGEETETEGEARLTAADGSVLPDTVELASTHYRQTDPAWADLIMQKDGDDIGTYGCALTSLSMAASFYGIDLDPAELNSALGDYADPVEWAAFAAQYGLLIGRQDSSLDPGSRLTDRAYVRDQVIRELAGGNPVILGLRLKDSGNTHFVLCYGYSYSAGSYSVLVKDPSTNNDYQTLAQIPDTWEVYRLLTFYVSDLNASGENAS
ncbi:MAG: C39 family peptidase [Oscillospiraceae bacterium]|nr:C39 family peptidase [Oscillospiraceae bacterium]MDD4368513.1 C39 family peptidase [Oscillospiraceae bacterium]